MSHLTSDTQVEYVIKLYNNAGHELDTLKSPAYANDYNEAIELAKEAVEYYVETFGMYCTAKIECTVIPIYR